MTASPAARIVGSAALLVAFVAVIRGLPPEVRRSQPGVDCERTQNADIRALERCLLLQPDDVEAMTDLGDAYEAASLWDRAEDVYRRALAVDANNGDVHVRLGHLLLRRGDQAAAMGEAQAALRMQPKSPAAAAIAASASGAAR